METQKASETLALETYKFYKLDGAKDFQLSTVNT